MYVKESCMYMRFVYIHELYKCIYMERDVNIYGKRYVRI